MKPGSKAKARKNADPLRDAANGFLETDSDFGSILVTYVVSLRGAELKDGSGWDVVAITSLGREFPLTNSRQPTREAVTAYMGRLREVIKERYRTHPMPWMPGGEKQPPN